VLKLALEQSKKWAINGMSIAQSLRKEENPMK
jgi:hypothetical protein